MNIPLRNLMKDEIEEELRKTEREAYRRAEKEVYRRAEKEVYSRAEKEAYRRAEKEVYRKAEEDTARKMLADGVAEENVIKYTSLDADSVRELAKGITSIAASMV